MTSLSHQQSGQTQCIMSIPEKDQAHVIENNARQLVPTGRAARICSQNFHDGWDSWYPSYKSSSKTNPISGTMWRLLL